ncbi:MAG: CBS domain-containing protein [Actinobacteria bacterium]|nr:CBS domain-containing protein [Actinomycetota bacterium]
MDSMPDISHVRISEVMTKMPRCIESHQSLDLAGKWMNELNVRHLPVREAGKVVGILSDRDLGLMLGSDSSRKPEPKRKVEDAMISNVLTVLETQTVKDVAEQMLVHKVGSAVIAGPDGSVSGIFTDTDALKILCGRV